MALGNPHVDYFSLDIEGAELAMLKTLPWDKIKAVLKNKYPTNTKTFDEDKLIAVVMAKAPEKYGSVITSVIREKGASLKLNDMKKAMPANNIVANFF